MNKDLILLTFPRSGMNYFINYFYQSSSKLITNFHEYYQVESFLNINNKTINDYNLCTIIRNPLDTIVSSTILVEHFRKDLEQEMIKKIINEIKNNYILFYKNNILKIKYVIDYEDLVKDPSLTIKTFGDIVGIPTKQIKYFDNLVDMPNAGYLVSSKFSKNYSAILEIAKNIDLQECFNLYYLALNNKILIN
jgi:hypothetical protein